MTTDTPVNARESDAGEVKACCAAGYGADAVSLLLGESYHPGGAGLTRRLARALDLAPDSVVLDVASGRGASAILLAAEHGCTVHGVDLGARQIGQATDAAAEAGLGGSVSFTLADAENLPFPGSMFDALICECAFCTFPDKEQAAREFARVLAPGGRAGITDVTVTGVLPLELRTLTAWIACIADARSTADYRALLTGAGLVVERIEDHNHALAGMLDRIEARLNALAMTAPTLLEAANAVTATIRPYLAAVRREMAAGTIGYTLIAARKPLRGPTREITVTGPV
ncbi:class I SAM-dependent methyltransferase [Arthrobacter bambusae]|uniref:class I SAM-dependent methyltransferase n=1 Tax=Arthrobacter bambusae TaxID=1338426 RepID=UPI002788508A|nr:methyltransferase domain-containing protein [Arthrobacter bambusae]MDQ0213110.1 SAM-dependent methyltransferase [Arthrobacter bambusae]MDQ0237440.1 SAM-dependent methyltransferase [Arthrobacter bambusae]